jgi:outer membrane protein TolC
MLLSLWAVGLCPARAEALSAADAVARTRVNNERVHGAAARVEAARARLERARALLWPDVAATAA